MQQPGDEDFGEGWDVAEFDGDWIEHGMRMMTTTMVGVGMVDIRSLIR